MNWIKTHITTHLGYLVIIGVVLFAGRVWLQEHDARLRADAQVKAAQATIDGLEKQQTTIQKQAETRVIVLQKEAAAIQTAPEAVTALITPATVKAVTPVNAAPLDAKALPDAPGKVSVDALPLYQTLNTCKQDEVNLTACNQELGIQKQISTQKDVQITALKKKPSFFSRLGKGLKVIACAGAGAAAGSLSKSPMGPAVGAATGAAVCQMF